MIAISYRREDSLPTAGRLYDRLQAKFGKENVFMDFDSIPPGMDFREQIKQMIERSKLVIAIIGPHWLGEQPDASRRIDNPADFVRLEIAYALERGIPIIPVLVNNTPMPPPEKLPQEIEGLAFRNALMLDTGIDFHHHADRLITGIGKAMDVTPRSRGTRKVPEPTGSAVNSRLLRKIVIWSAAILLSIAASALVVWYVAMHRHEQAKQALSDSGPTAKPSVSIAPSVEPSSPGTALTTAPSPTAVELLTLSVGSSVYSLAFSPDGTRIVTGAPIYWLQRSEPELNNDYTAKVWDAQSGKELLTLKGHSYNVHSVAFSPDGTRIVTGSTDATKVWDAQSGKELLTLSVGFDGVKSVAFSPDGTRIVTGSTDATAKVWDVQSGKELLTLKGHFYGVNSVAFSPDGARMVTGGADATAKVWDTHSGKELLTLKGHSDNVSSVAFSPDGTRLVTGSYDHTGKVWDTNNGKELLTLKGHSDNVNSVAFSPDGRRIATGGTDGAKVWDAHDGQELLILEGHSYSDNSVAFSPDGRRIATGGTNGVKVWRVNDRNDEKSSPPLESLSPSAPPNNTGAQTLTRVKVKKYGVSALLPTDVFPDAKKLSNSDQSFLQGNSWTGQTTLTFSSVREPLAKVYAECATEHSPQAPSKTVQYKVLKPTWFVVSGDLGPEADASLGFYTKGVKKDGVVVIMHFQWREDDFPFREETFTAMSRGFDGN